MLLTIIDMNLKASEDIKSKITIHAGQKEVDNPLQDGARQCSELSAILEVFDDEQKLVDLIIACRIGLSRIGNINIPADLTTVHVMKENPDRPIDQALLDSLKKTLDSAAIDQGIKTTREKAAILLVLQEDDPVMIQTLTGQL